MSKNKQIALFTSTFFLGVILLISQVFLFEKPIGDSGFLLAFFSFTLITVSCARLGALTDSFMDWAITLFDFVTSLF